MSSTRRFEASQDDIGERLDARLAAWLERPRNQVRKWIQDGHVDLEGRSCKPSTPLVEGDRITCRIPAKTVDGRIEPEAGPLEVIYEDPHLIVLDKPAGLAVHPGAGRPTGTLVHFLLDRYPELSGVGGEGRPGIVHRLDLDTTGLMIIARQEASYLTLVQAFAERRVKKNYQAIAYGIPGEGEGSIDLPIARHRGDRKKMAVSQRGRPSRTLYRCVDQGGGISRFDLDLQTGRTHQIRVHLKAIHHPLVGDPLYGEARWKQWPRKQQGPLKDFPRPALHAWRLRFAHPATGSPLEFEAPVPEDMRRLWRAVTRQDWLA